MRFRPLRDKTLARDAPAPDRGTHVLIGGRVVARADIRSVAAARQSDRDIDGQLLNFSVYLLIAALFLILVVEYGWRTRFLLGTGFFAAVGLMAFADVLGANRLTYWRIDVQLTGGEIIPLAVHTEAQRDRWLAHLGAA